MICTLEFYDNNFDQLNQINKKYFFTGQLLYSYNQLGYVKAVSAAHFHPHDNYIAFCCYGDSQPILIYTYDPKGFHYILFSDIFFPKLLHLS